MVVFPNSKINLGLRILRKRADGYHDLETVFYPIQLTDILEIIPGNKTAANHKVTFSKSGFHIEGDPSDNLCIKAYRLLKKDFPSLPAIQMHLHKAIPAGAGLGGGSADGAFTLMLLNSEFGLGLSQDQLLSYAARLGSDCPFFIINKPSIGTGRGEILESVEVDLSACRILVVNPRIHINTGRAFLHSKPSFHETPIREVVTRPIERWKDELHNDFETWVFSQYREIVEIKDQMYIAGALYASMSGSGSTVYGIFPRDIALNLEFDPRYFVKMLE